MTNTQLYLSIGVPVLFNFGIMLTLFILLNSNMNARFDGTRNEFNERFNGLNQRFDDMRDLWRAELRRVEEVIDARLKHLEEK